jgi:protein ImuA
MSHLNPLGADPATIARLRARIWALEEGSTPPPVLSIGAPDAALPWGGLPLARLHQIVAGDESALGFAAALLGLVACARPVLWCGRRGAAGPFLPGLAAFGLAPERVLLAEARNTTETLWVMEEGLRCAALGAVLGESAGIGLAAARRLQLAAEAGGVTGLVVTPARAAEGGATTRWRVAAAPSGPASWSMGDGLGPPAWRVELERCRGGLPRSWVLAWRDGCFAPHRDPALAQ